MKVTEIMKRTPGSCGRDANLAEATSIMWERDCGFVPVVDEKDRVIGVITDRDIAIALGTRGKLASDLKVGEIMNTRLHTCSMEDSVQEALDAMAANRIRRLPVIDRQGRIQGIVSINDAIRATTPSEGGTRASVATADVMTTLRTICQPHWQLSRAAQG